MDCYSDDNGQTICVDTEALKGAALDFAGDIAGDLFGFGGGSSSSSTPKKETAPAPVSKNYTDGTQCFNSDFDCLSGCCKENYILDVPEDLKSYLNYDDDLDFSEETVKVNKWKGEEIASTWSLIEVAYPNPEFFPDNPKEGVPPTIEPSVKPDMPTEFLIDAYLGGVEVPIRYRPDLSNYGQESTVTAEEAEIIAFEPLSVNVWNYTKVEENLNPTGAKELKDWKYRFLTIYDIEKNTALINKLSALSAKYKIESAAVINGYINVQ